MKIYRDTTISDQTFVLEEVAFFNCTLKNCDFFFSGGDVEIRGCATENCRVYFRGAAKSTLALMQLMGMISGPTQLPMQVQSKPN